MTNIKNPETNLLGINQILFISANITAYEIDSVNSLYLVFNDVDVYFECIDEIVLRSADCHFA